jgi:hypothetical protein
MSKYAVVALILSGLIVATSPSNAGVPSLLNFQGVLRNAAGETVPDGNYSVTFRVWDAETVGAALWQEGRLVTVQKGLFTVLLGSIVPIPESLFNRPDRWLSLQVGLDPEMMPRQRLVTVPFAWHAGQADRADTAGHSLDKTKSASELNSGTLDTARYSAYADLLSEGRIGPGADQVAAGDHVHPDLGYRILEDTTTVTNYISFSGGEVTFKTLTIPAGGLGSFLKFSGLCLSPGSVEATTRVNGLLIESASALPNVGRYFGNQIIRFGGGTLWDTRFDAPITVDPTSTVTITFGASTSSSTPVRVDYYTVLVEYAPN